MAESEVPPYRIVVGFDGSEGAQRALTWAAEETRQRGGHLDVLRAWTRGEFGTDAEMAQIAQKTLDSEVATFFAQRAAPDFSTHAEEGHAAKVRPPVRAGRQHARRRLPGPGRLHRPPARLGEPPGGDPRRSARRRHRAPLTWSCGRART